MSDRDLRRILNEIIDDFDAGRIQTVRTRLPTVRNVVGSAVIAVTLGLGGVACDTESVGSANDATTTTTDAATGQDAATQIDGGMDLLYMAPIVDAGPMPEYAEPFIDAGDVPAYMGPYWDASVDPDEDAGPQTAYGVPPVPPEE